MSTLAYGSLFIYPFEMYKDHRETEINTFSLKFV